MNEVPAPPPERCFACECDRKGHRASTAFVAGIGFALQYNTASIATRLCVEHRVALVRGHIGTRDLAKPAQRRAR